MLREVLVAHESPARPDRGLLDSGGLLQSLKRGHGENWEGRVAKKRGKHVGQVEVAEVEVELGREVVEKRRRRASSSSGEEERRVFRRRRSSGEVLKRELRRGSDYGSLSSLDSDMLK